MIKGENNCDAGWLKVKTIVMQIWTGDSCRIYAEIGIVKKQVLEVKVKGIVIKSKVLFEKFSPLW